MDFLDWTETCCECGEEFAPSGGAGYKTAMRGTHRYVVGHLCEDCMGGRKRERGRWHDFRKVRATCTKLIS